MKKYQVVFYEIRCRYVQTGVNQRAPRLGRQPEISSRSRAVVPGC